MLAGQLYLVGAVLIGCVYARCFREHRETWRLTVVRGSVLGLAWPLIALLLIAFVWSYSRRD